MAAAGGGQLRVTKRELLTQREPARAGPIKMKRSARMVVAMLRLRPAARDCDQLAERLGVPDRQLRQHLSVDVDAGELQAMHELVIGHSLAARGGIDAG